MNEWIDVNVAKPETDLLTYVTNVRSGVQCFAAIYDKYDDCFRLYDHKMFDQIPIDVTHWIPLPPPPRIPK